jgi:hypothetical protein
MAEISRRENANAAPGNAGIAGPREKNAGSSRHMRRHLAPIKAFHRIGQTISRLCVLWEWLDESPIHGAITAIPVRRRKSCHFAPCWRPASSRRSRKRQSFEADERFVNARTLRAKLCNYLQQLHSSPFSCKWRRSGVLMNADLFQRWGRLVLAIEQLGDHKLAVTQQRLLGPLVTSQGESAAPRQAQYLCSKNVNCAATLKELSHCHMSCTCLDGAKPDAPHPG